MAEKSFAALGIVLILLSGVSAQSGRKLPSNTQQNDGPVRLRTDEVLLNVAVVDPYGRNVADLAESEFIIAEDGKRQDIASFILGMVPVNVVLLLDASGSVAGDISFLRQAALQFINELRPADRVAVMSFHSDASLLQDWTSKPDDVAHAISWRYKPGMIRTKEGHSQYGSTSLYDALYLAAEEQLAKVEGRKAVIILTDGDDSSSGVTYDQALAAVVRSGATVYVVSRARALIAEANKYRGRIGRVFGGGSAQVADFYVSRLERAEHLMTKLVNHTGGLIFSPMTDKDLASMYAQVARELKSQYIITYVPSNEARDGKLRRIQVFLTRPGYEVRTRDGYYAPRE